MRFQSLNGSDWSGAAQARLVQCAAHRAKRVIRTVYYPALVMAWTIALRAGAFTADTPVTPDASPEARALLTYFAESYGTKIIAGQHDGWRMTNGASTELNYIASTTGKLPALLEFDMTGCTGPHRDTNHFVMKHAAAWAQNQHGIVACCWHWRAPMREPAFYTKDTTFDIARAVTPGTAEYAATGRDLDTIAGELEIPRDAHVPVLWRPLHEANGRWFWWGAGGPEPFKKLWRMMFDNFTVKHRLNNLIWVFSPGAETDLADWYPGDAFVDIVGQDHYPMDGNHGSAKDVFDELTTLTRGQKLIALGENGPIPDPALVVHDHAGWLFFSTWAGSVLFDKTTAAQLREYYRNPYVVTLTNLPDGKSIHAATAGNATQLSFCGAPGDVAAGGTWRMPLAVAVRDKHGVTVREGSYTVTLALKNATGTNLSGTVSAETVHGIATFPGVHIDAAATGCRLTAMARGLQTGTSAPFTVGPGNGLLREWWTVQTGSSPGLDDKEVLGKALETPVQLVTNFAARISGELIPPQTGQYKFWIAGGGAAELWLGTDDTAASKRQIAALTRSTPYQKWPHASEAASQTATLQAGRHYYFEIRQRQDMGSSQLHARWQLPDGSEERPIPAFRFALPEKSNQPQ